MIDEGAGARFSRSLAHCGFVSWRSATASRALVGCRKTSRGNWLAPGFPDLQPPWDWFVADSLLEGSGFKLTVPVRQAKLTRSCR
jgi:hypothetical protein